MTEQKIDINQIVTQTSIESLDELLAINAENLRQTLEIMVDTVEKSLLFSVEGEKVDYSLILKDPSSFPSDLETGSKLARILVDMGHKALEDYDPFLKDRELLTLWCYRVTKIFDAYVEIVLIAKEWIKNNQK